MKPKRAKRRLEREKTQGPERRIVNLAMDHAVLECGHVIVDPPRHSLVTEPKYYRCIECLGT